MGQQLGQWRSADGQRLWLSMLVKTMEEISRADRRNVRCSPSLLIAVQAHLERPASPYAVGASPYSLRN
jgi:hypothetical protein